MTRDEFIARLKEVGFWRVGYYSNDLWWVKRPPEHNKPLTNLLHLFENKDMFTDTEDADKVYTFDELEQFLIDNGIVEAEKPFDAHEYLLSKGFTQMPYFDRGYFKSTYEICHSLTTISISANNNSKVSNIRNDSKIYLEPFNKQSCDKAIKLIDFLIELEKE